MGNARFAALMFCGGGNKYQSQVEENLRELRVALPQGACVASLPALSDAMVVGVWSSISEQKGFDIGPLSKRHQLVASTFPVLVSSLDFFACHGITG
jgi:hypothetical protein